MKSHKHAKLIKAWANGAKIQWWNAEHRKWFDLDDSRPFSWDESIVYSIKPEEKKPVVRWLWAKQVLGDWQISPVYRSKEEALKTFNSPFICLEYTRTEFPE